MGSQGLDFKECKACTDFKSWARSQSVKYEGKMEEKRLVPRDDCPLDSGSLGVVTWNFLHTMAAYYPNKPTEKQQTHMKSFMDLFSEFYPCKVCADDFKKDLKMLPPETQSAESLSQWMCKIHNRVNDKLGKPRFDCTKVFERWRDGWKDGSCD